MAHQHQEMDFGQISGRACVEMAFAMLDGVMAVEGQRLTGTELRARQPLRT
jgi:hypothetical protein